MIRKDVPVLSLRTTLKLLTIRMFFQHIIVSSKKSQKETLPMKVTVKIKGLSAIKKVSKETEGGARQQVTKRNNFQ